MDQQIPRNLLNFCLSHSDFKENDAETVVKQLTDSDKEFLRNALESVEDPVQTMVRLTKELDKPEAEVSADKKAELLEEYVELVENLDNAINLIKINAYPVIMKCTSDANARVRANALWVVGAACQNHTQVAVEAVTAGFLHRAIALLRDASGVVAKKALFACSSIVRTDPRFVQAFTEVGGIEATMHLVAFPETSTKALHLLRSIFPAENPAARSAALANGLVRMIVSAYGPGYSTSAGPEVDESTRDAAIQLASKIAAWPEANDSDKVALVTPLQTRLAALNPDDSHERDERDIIADALEKVSQVFTIPR